MNMHNTEQMRQHNDYKAIQARLWGKPKVPAPVLTVIESRKPVDASYHMVLYRAYQARLRETFTMGASFTVNPTATQRFLFPTSIVAPRFARFNLTLSF